MYNSDLPKRADLPSSKQLLRSTIIAIIVAAVLLITIVLPSEYGIDPTGIGRLFGLTQMGEIKMTLAAEAKQAAEAENAQAKKKKKEAVQPEQTKTDAQNTASKKNEMTVTLKPGEGVEIKMDMVKGAKVTYEWKTNGGKVNHDTHGEGAKKAFISYKKGTGVEGDAGDLVAEFDGSHGWFWRNRSSEVVIIALKAEGEYKSFTKMG